MMKENYYIQRTGEFARDIWRFFQVFANKGVLSAEPSNPNQGDIYVNSSTFESGVYTIEEGIGAWSYLALKEGDKVYDGVLNISYVYTSGSLQFDLNYDGIYVKKTSNISTLPDRKDPYSEDWKDEQGVDTFVPDSTYFKSKEVTVELFIKDASLSKLRTKLDIFLKYATAKGYINYFDTLKGQGFRGYFKSHSVQDEKYRDGMHWQEFSLTFVVDRLCYGYDCTQCGTLSITMNEGIDGLYDLHLSDGNQFLKFNEDTYVSSENCKFVIIVPDYLDLLTITCSNPGVIGIDSESEQVLIGIEGDTVVFGI